jgi:hypothetical protein
MVVLVGTPISSLTGEFVLMCLVYKDFNSSKKKKKIETSFYVVRSMTYVYKIKPNGLHYTLISLDEFTIREAPIYRRIVESLGR